MFFCYRHCRYAALESALTALAGNPRSFVVGEEFDTSRRKCWKLMKNPEYMYRHIRKKSNKFVEYTCYYEVIPNFRGVKLYLDIEWP